MSLAIAGGLLLAHLSAARAQTCEPGSPQDALQYLRRLSLDLRGRVPDYSEFQTVAMAGSIDPSMIDQMIASPDFLHQMENFHRDMFWTNITDQRLAQVAWSLRPPATTGAYPAPAYYIASQIRQLKYRGAQVACLDQPAQFSPTGNILTTTTTVMDPMGNPTTALQEGWVMVSPYWAPATQVKVCAFDAQSAMNVLDPATNKMVNCSLNPSSALCGCGPNLNWCESRADNTTLTILSSMDKQLLMFANDIVAHDRPYTDLLTAQDMYINGPIVHFLRYQYFAAGANGIIASPRQSYNIPDLTFDQVDNWVKVTRTGNEAGVETMPAYLLKFQSDRGRANRFYNAFFGRYYQAGTLPSNGMQEQGCDNTNPDITKRCFCRDCHAGAEGVESLAAYFGRLGEASLVPLTQDANPANDPTCSASTRPSCVRFYITQRDIVGMTDSPLQPYLGWLRTYAFADDTRKAHIEAGPAALASYVIGNNNTFAQAIAWRLWTRFMGHAPVDADQNLIVQLAQDFANGYQIKALIKAIVISPQYVEASRYKAGM
jgi:hypothetical protein